MSNYYLKKIKLGTCVIPHFYGIFTVESIYSLILMTQGHLQGRKVNSKVKYLKV